MSQTRRQTPSVTEVTIGALLHDIGKLMQRGVEGSMPPHILERANDILPVRNGQYSHWHALWSDAFFDWIEQNGHSWPEGVDADNVRDMAVYHHKPLQAYPDAPWRAMTWLVTVADRLASGFERRPIEVPTDPKGRDRNAFRRTPLDAITASLKLDKPARSGVHVPAILAADTILPKLDCQADQVVRGYKAVWHEFCEGWGDLASRSKDDTANFEQGLLSLLETTTWAVPSSTVDQPDIPLLDHSRAVAAFAAALYHHHAYHGELANEAAIRDATRPRFRFLVGDLSGLQRALFRLATEGIKGQNKLLRGRSFRFQLIADAAARRVLQACEMPFSAALQTAGGRFLLLLPETDEAEINRKVDELRVEMEQWLAEQYCGDLGIGLSLSEPFAAQDLIQHGEDDTPEAAISRANKVRDKMLLAIETAKLRQMQVPLTDAVVSYEYPHGSCHACGVRPALIPRDDLSPSHCISCDAELRLGQRLPKAEYVAIDQGSAEKAEAADRIFGLDYRMPHGQWKSGQGWRIAKAVQGPAARRLGEAYVPVFDGDGSYLELDEPAEIGAIKSFQMLSQDALEDGKGRGMLAVLKADVDRLGMLFSKGIEQRFSIARSSVLSRMVDTYFSVRLPELLRQKYPNVYTVFAGGDDLMLVAPWRDAFAFAETLSRDFAQFSMENPNVTLSSGIALFDARTPMTRAAEEAEMRLESAKLAGRNRVSAITGVMTWGNYYDALRMAEKLNAAMREGKLPTAMAYRLLSLNDARQRVADGESNSGDYAWRAKLGYQLARINDPELQETILSLFNLNSDLQSEGSQFANARFALTHAIYRNR